MIDVKKIMEYIPHRYPFLLVDRVVEVEPMKSITAIKNVSMNEPHFQGHFPGNPIMPGVLIVEALAQASGIMVTVGNEEEGKLGVLTGIDGCKVRRQVVPGDTLTLKAEIVKMKRGIVKVKATATVEDEVACAAEITFALIDQP